MAKTIDELKAQSAQVKKATVVGENTATRVGTLFTDIVEHVEEAEQTIIYDVSARNNGTVFKSISALLNNSNLDTLIPVSFRHGGMIIRFIQGSEQSSDNKYVQYRLMNQSFSATESDWQGVDDVPTAGSDNIVTGGGFVNSLSDIPFVEELYIDNIIGNPYFNGETKLSIFFGRDTNGIYVSICHQDSTSHNSRLIVDGNYGEKNLNKRYDDIVILKNTDQGCFFAIKLNKILTQYPKIDFHLYSFVNAVDIASHSILYKSPSIEAVLTLKSKENIFSRYIKEVYISDPQNTLENSNFITFRLWKMREGFYAAAYASAGHNNTYNLIADINYAEARRELSSVMKLKVFNSTAYPGVEMYILLNTDTIDELGTNDTWLDAEVFIPYAKEECNSPVIQDERIRLFYLINNTNKWILKNDGTTTYGESFVNFSTSDYILIPDDAAFIKYSRCYTIGLGAWAGLCLYDSNKAFISGAAFGYSGYIQLSDYPTAKYVRFCGENNVPPSDHSILEFILRNEYCNDVKCRLGEYPEDWLGLTLYNFNSTEDGGWATGMYSESPKDGIITKLRVNVANAGTYTFCVGFKDQRNLVADRQLYQIALVEGENIVDVNWHIKKDYRLFIQINTSVKYYNSLVSSEPLKGTGIGSNFYYSKGDNVALHLLGDSESFGGMIAFDYEVTYSNYLSKTELSDINTRIVSLENNKNVVVSPDGSRFLLQVSNLGVLSAVKMSRFTKMFVFGNSYTANYVTDFWWHTGSMAATRREYSWWNLLKNGIASTSPNMQVLAHNAYEFDQGWEQKLDNADLSGLDTLLNNNTDIDIVILQLGGNVTASTETYKTALINLINNHFKQILDNPLFVFTNMASGGYGNVNIEVCNQFGGIWVDVSSIPITHPTADTVIYDENDTGHTIGSGTNPGGVCAHPDNAYFAQIAKLFIEALQ